MQHETNGRGAGRRQVPFFAVLVVLMMSCAVALAACGGGSSSSSSSTTESTTEGTSGETETTSGESGGSSEPSGEPVVFGGLEGEVAEAGPDFMTGMHIGIEELNAEGGINGRPVELKIFKTHGTPQGAATAYQQAGAESDVLGVFMAATGPLAIREQSERVKLPLIAASGNEKIDVPVTKYIFQNAAGKEYMTSALAYLNEHGAEYAKATGREWSGGTMKGKKIAVLHYETDFSLQIPESMEEGCEVLGCEITDMEEASATDSIEQITPQLTKMKESGAEIYYIEGLNPNGLAAAKQLGMDDKPVIAEQWLTVPALAEAAGKNAEGVVFGGHKCRVAPLLKSSDPAKAWCDHYIKEFERAYPGEPFSLVGIYGNDAVHIYAWAVEHLEEEGKEITRDSMVEALQEMNGSLRTSHGLPKTSPEDHRITGTFNEAYVDEMIKVKPNGEIEYTLAPGADPEGTASIGPHAGLEPNAG
jgi:branched-chain amino acid transport system substrate-binding protein